MTLRRWFFANMVYRAAVVSRGEAGVYRHLASLQKVAATSPEQVAERRGRHLAEALAYAWRAAPLYRERWPGEPPSDPEGAWEYLAALPILEKADLQSNAAGLHSQLPLRDRVSRKTTGGSTGQAVTILKNGDAIAREMASSWLALGWVGVRMGDKAARFWGNPVAVKRRLRFWAADFAMNRIRFSAFAFDENDLDSYWRRCLSFSPDYFYGYVSMLTSFASHLQRKGEDGSRLGLKAVVTTSEVLSPADERLLQEVFACPVQNEYGCGEVGPIAYSMGTGGPLFVMVDNVEVEVLTEAGHRAGPGEDGELVITDLNNRAMPLVRYRVGDRATVGEPTSVGTEPPFPKLTRVWGRSYDFVLGLDGRRFHGEYFMYLFEEMRDKGLGVEKFQVRQSARDRIEIHLVTDGELEARTEFLTRRTADTMPGVGLSVERASEIPRLPSGKMALIINEIPTHDLP